jgi:hypothetical protein
MLPHPFADERLSPSARERVPLKDQEERLGRTWFVIVPATLCFVLGAWGAARRLGRHHPEWG